MTRIATAVVESAPLSPLSPRAVRREFDALLEAGARIECAGKASKQPLSLLSLGYLPRHKVELFGTTFYVTGPRQNPLLRFFVAYLVPPASNAARTRIYPRIFYKDISLIWRCASHIVSTKSELWIGKGDVEIVREGGWEHMHTLESTTDLPFELQEALEACARQARRIPHDEEVLRLVLRNAPPHRIWPYADFSAPRRKAEADPRNLIHRGKRVAYFKRHHVPGSLEFAPGFEPDFADGLIEVADLSSSTYGGALKRYRFLSVNRKIQYMFFAGKAQVWIIPPQALTTELSTYGLRTIHVAIDDDLCLPGFEYHFHVYEDEPDSLHSQIPPGFAGDPNHVDPDRADASAWIDQLPVVQRFRREVLKKKSPTRRKAPRKKARK